MEGGSGSFEQALLAEHVLFRERGLELARSNVMLASTSQR